jgi:hypothetical protein
MTLFPKKKILGRPPVMAVWKPPQSINEIESLAVPFWATCLE